MVISKLTKIMLPGSRFGLAMLAAGILSFSNLASAGAQEDYDAGYKSYLENDMMGAMSSFRKAANAGHVKAMVLLAELLDISDFDEEALARYRQAAEKGDADGMFGLATMLAAGEGLKNKDPFAARPWFEKAAELGHPGAIEVLAEAYLQGNLGLTDADRNSPEALRWIQRAAKNDYLPALEALIKAYRSGNMLGVSADDTLAQQYSEQAVKLRGEEKTKGKKRKKS